MNEVLLIYWTGTGNTGKMAELIKKGIEEVGRSVTLLEVFKAKPSDVEEYNNIILGCPSMGDEVLEESEMEPFVQAIESKVNGKNIALFGSYGWGSGEWMIDWHNRMAEHGANMLFQEDLIVNDAPTGSSEAECIQYGNQIGKEI